MATHHASSLFLASGVAGEALSAGQASRLDSGKGCKASESCYAMLLPPLHRPCQVDGPQVFLTHCMLFAAMLDAVPICSPRRESQAALPQEVSLLWHSLPRVSQGESCCI
jgi:hypothetical protein